MLMKNVGGLIAFDIIDSDITSVTLYDNSGKDLSGIVTAVFDKDGIPVVTSVEGSNMIRMVPASGNVFEPAHTISVYLLPSLKVDLNSCLPILKRSMQSCQATMLSLWNEAK